LLFAFFINYLINKKKSYFTCILFIFLLIYIYIFLLLLLFISLSINFYFHPHLLFHSQSKIDDDDPQYLNQ
jgi:hypothetical protein